MTNASTYTTLPTIAGDNSERVLSIYLTYRGFGFTVFEGAKSVLDWGNAHIEGQNKDIFEKRITALVEADKIERIVCYTGHGRPVAIQRNIANLKTLGNKVDVKVELLSKDEISNVFEAFGSYTKYQRAGLVAAYLPDLAYKLPPKRKCFEGEDLRMAIFDSAALAIAYFYMK